MVIWLGLVNLAAGTAESGLEGLGRRGVPCQDADSNCWGPPSINRFKVELIHPGLTLRVQDVNGTEILLPEFHAKSHGETGETGETVQNIPIFSHKSGLTGTMPPWCHKSSASGPGHVAMEISHWDGYHQQRCLHMAFSNFSITMFVDQPTIIQL